MSESNTESSNSKSEYDSSDSEKIEKSSTQEANASVDGIETNKKKSSESNSSESSQSNEKEKSSSVNNSNELNDANQSSSQSNDKNDEPKKADGDLEKSAVSQKGTSKKDDDKKKSKLEKKSSKESLTKKDKKDSKSSINNKMAKDEKKSKDKETKSKNDDKLEIEKGLKRKKRSLSDVGPQAARKKPIEEEDSKSKSSKEVNAKQLTSSEIKKENLNQEEIPKMSFSGAPSDEKKDETSSKSDENQQSNEEFPVQKRKSAVTFCFPAVSAESDENLPLRNKSKSNNDIYSSEINKNNRDHDEISDPINSVNKEEMRKHVRASSNPGKPTIDPRMIPRRFSKMTIEQIDEVIDKEDRLLDAITFFNQNKDPSKLCEYYEVEETPSNIAQIFWGTKDINSVTLGRYLLKKKDMLDAYFMEVEMNKGPIQSLRNALLGPMRFDGESQTVHKVLSSISRCYSQKNPDKCDDPDNMLDLYYALIMLNTDLSNPNNKSKMTLQEFISNTKGANEFLSTLTDEELTGYYKNIAKRPLLFQNQSDDFTYEFCPKIRGYLKKKSLHTFGTWTKKYFVLINSCLYYFADDSPENAKCPVGALYLKGVEPFRNRDTDPLLIRITAKKKKEIKYAKFINRQKDNPRYVKGIKEILLEAPDRASSSKWFHRIRVAAQVSNFIKEKKVEDTPPEQNVYETDIPDAADDAADNEESAEEEECDQ